MPCSSSRCSAPGHLHALGSSIVHLPATHENPCWHAAPIVVHAAPSLSRAVHMPPAPEGGVQLPPAHPFSAPAVNPSCRQLLRARSRCTFPTRNRRAESECRAGDTPPQPGVTRTCPWDAGPGGAQLGCGGEPGLQAGSPVADARSLCLAPDGTSARRRSPSPAATRDRPGSGRRRPCRRCPRSGMRRTRSSSSWWRPSSSA